MHVCGSAMLQPKKRRESVAPKLKTLGASSHTAPTVDPLADALGRGWVGAAIGCRETLKMLVAAPTIEPVVDCVGEIVLLSARLPLRIWAWLPLRLLVPLPLPLPLPVPALASAVASDLAPLLPLPLLRHKQPHRGSTSGGLCRDNAQRMRLALKPITPQQKLRTRVVPELISVGAEDEDEDEEKDKEGSATRPPRDSLLMPSATRSGHRRQGREMKGVGL